MSVITEKIWESEVREILWMESFLHIFWSLGRYFLFFFLSFFFFFLVSSVVPFSSCLQSFPASGSFLMSQLFASGSQSMELQLQHQSFQWIFRVDFLSALDSPSLTVTFQASYSISLSIRWRQLHLSSRTVMKSEWDMSKMLRTGPSID